MDHRLSAAGIALLLTGWLLAGSVSAQEDEVLVPDAHGMAPGQEILVPQPVPPAESYPVYPPGWVPAPVPPPHYCWNGPVSKWVHSLCCWSHHNCYGCGSVESDLTFIFGSCRSFYVEPCAKGPAPFLVPVGYAPPPPQPCPGGNCNRY